VPVFVLTLQCQDRPGIVRAASTAVFNVEGNILENDQFTDPMTNEFCMRTRFETPLSDPVALRAALYAEVEAFEPNLNLRPEATLRRALVMVSKFDHCLADLLYRRRQGDLPLDIAVVTSNHDDCRDLAQSHGVPFVEIPVSSSTRDAAEQDLRHLIAEHDVDFIILARYMQILSPSFCHDFAGRIINIHHSFLPGFKGAKPYHQAYERGVKLIGATAHFVTSDLDEGPIIEQDVVRVSHARQPHDLVSLGRDIERNVLSRAVKLLAEDRVTLVGQRTVIFSQ
jgi:formyltetrahydrofolate deformylase